MTTPALADNPASSTLGGLYRTKAKPCDKSLNQMHPIARVNNATEAKTQTYWETSNTKEEKFPIAIIILHDFSKRIYKRSHHHLTVSYCSHEKAQQRKNAMVSDSMPWYETTGTVLIALSLPSLAEAAVPWSEETRGAYNTITLVLRPNFAVVAGTAVRVTGLLDFDSSDVPCKPAKLY